RRGRRSPGRWPTREPPSCKPRLQRWVRLSVSHLRPFPLPEALLPMSAPADSPARLTLRDLPLPAKLVVTAFLISVGLGYLWAMAQIHFKHGSPGNPMPTLEDLVARFSGVPWPLEPKPEPESKEKANKEIANADAIGVQ